MRNILLWIIEALLAIFVVSLFLAALTSCRQPDRPTELREITFDAPVAPPVVQQVPVIDYNRLNLILDNQRQQVMSELRRILLTMRSEEDGNPAPALVPVPEPQPTPAVKPTLAPISLKPLAAAGKRAIGWLMSQDWNPAPECLACPGGVCSVPGSSLPKLSTALSDAAEAEEKSKAVMGRVFELVAFIGPDCKYCDQMKPVWASIQKEGFTVVTVDVNNPPAWVGGWKPPLVPVTVLYEDDPKLVDKFAYRKQWVGVVSRDELLDALRNGVAVPLGPVLESPENPALMVAAKESAKLQADRNRQGHVDWDNRSQRIIQLSGFRRVREICAESWPEEVNASEDDLWKSAFKSWVQSPGHWTVAGVRHDAFGKGLAKGSNGIWFMCIIVGDNIGHPRPNLSLSNLRNLPSTDSHFASDGSVRFSSIAPKTDSANIMFCQFCSVDFGSAWSPICSWRYNKGRYALGPCCSLDNVSYTNSCHSKRLADSLWNFPSQITLNRLVGLFGGQFSIGSVPDKISSVSFFVGHVFLPSSPRQIGENIIGRVSVQVSALHIRGAGATKCEQNQSVYFYGTPFSIHFESDLHISVVPQRCFNDFVLMSPGNNDSILSGVVSREAGDWTNFKGRGRIGTRHGLTPNSRVVFRTAGFQPGCSFIITQAA